VEVNFPSELKHTKVFLAFSINSSAKLTSSLNLISLNSQQPKILSELLFWATEFKVDKTKEKNKITFRCRMSIFFVFKIIANVFRLGEGGV
jgi:hypothetical protein